MNSFKKNIISLYGAQGQAWLNNLPKLVSQIATKWALTGNVHLNNLSYNYVLSGMQGKTPVVLKIGFDKHAIEHEARTLQFFAGQGCVKLLKLDHNNGALLLEQAVPGHTLKTFFPKQDNEAIKITIQIIKKLQSVSSKELEKFPILTNWLKTLDKEWDIPQHHLKKARILSKQLLTTTKKQVLLHGDLHHENILLNKKIWVVIDPKGVVGDPVYEVGAFIRNPVLELHDNKEIKKIINNRITLFAELLDYDEQRIRDWSYVQMVLAACWKIEDSQDPQIFIELADIIDL